MVGRAWLAAALLAFLPVLAHGHDLGASEAFMVEERPAQYVLGVVAPSAMAGLFAAPRLPGRCGTAEKRIGDGQVRFAFACSGGPLAVDDRLVLPWQREGVLLTLRRLDAAPATHFFLARHGAITVDLAALQVGSASVLDAARRYTALGIEHILFGFDHLLFVASLLLLVRGPWMLVKTITAFTVAHSLTLALATLGLVEVPPAPVEACIALSIVLVAAEGLRDRGRGAPLRRPWAIAFAFGLLHGFGFAGALSELGLPPPEIPLALLFFNVGVEIGQLAFVGVALGGYTLLRDRLVRLPHWTTAIPGYAIGGLATLWFFERLAAIPG